MDGENFVSLVGKITWPDFKIVGEKSSRLFKSKLAIPIANYPGRFQYLKIAGWNAIAEALNEVPENQFIKLQGHIEERSYDGKCKHCGGFDKKYWTEVVVDNFIVLMEE
jgi:hypothetical protein